MISLHSPPPPVAELPADLPNPLVFPNGKAVTSSQEWQQKRRAEILHLFETQVYGRAPVVRLDQLAFHTDSVTPGLMHGAAIRHHVTLTITGNGGRKHSARFLLFLPARAARPVPTFVFICNRPADQIDADRKTLSPFWPAETLIARGFAAAAFQVDTFDPDDTNGYERGVRAALDTKRAPDAWGSIAAWAWGASRVMDYLQTVPEIDTKRVGVVGHSRGGKAALWCGATDERFALTVSNCSGCTGAALARGKTGERVADINKKFPYWFCENYKRYNGREADLPIDQHELLALIAPRRVYVTSATEDTWADPKSEFLSCVAASPVFRLFHRDGVKQTRMPAPGTPLQTGSIAYHLRTGKHDLTLYDWTQFMNYATPTPR